MKTLFQWIGAKFGWWRPKVGAVYELDGDGMLVRVIGIEEGIVSFLFVDLPGSKPSQRSIKSFAIVFTKVPA